MSDKQSLAEAVKSVRQYNRRVKKSMAGIGRFFEYDTKGSKAATTVEAGGSSVFPLAEPPVEEPAPVEPELRIKGRKKKEKVEKIKPAFEPPATRYRVKRNTMTLFL